MNEFENIVLTNLNPKNEELRKKVKCIYICVYLYVYCLTFVYMI